MACLEAKGDVRHFTFSSIHTFSDVRLVMHLQAANIMKHLETKREAAERRRVALMSKGIARFLERSSRESYLGSDEEHVHGYEGPQEDLGADGQFQNDIHDRRESGHGRPSTTDKESVLDKIRTALDYAADIIRESLELTSGGVVFLDPAIGYMENDNITTYADIVPDSEAQMDRTYRDEKCRQTSNENKLRPNLSQDSHPGGRHLSVGAIRSSTDKHKASKILAMSFGKSSMSRSGAETLYSKTLQSLIKSYPQGNVWYLDEEGYFSSLEQISEWEQRSGISPSGRTRSVSPINMTKKQGEAAVLSHIFKDARQIIFLPLWDAGGGMLSLTFDIPDFDNMIDRYYAGCFVWSESAVPVFTVDSELAYLSAFTNSVMVEISRLDAATANKMKGDFISSISRMAYS